MSLSGFLICQSLDFRYTVFNLLIVIFIYFALLSNKLEKSLKRIFFLLFLGQLTVPHDVISSSGVGDSALPGHPVRVGGSGAGNNFEMSPLISHEQMKDSIITLDYVSIKLFQLKSFEIERKKLSLKFKKLANQPPLEVFV